MDGGYDGPPPPGGKGGPGGPGGANRITDHAMSAEFGASRSVRQSARAGCKDEFHGERVAAALARQTAKNNPHKMIRYSGGTEVEITGIIAGAPIPGQIPGAGPLRYRDPREVERERRRFEEEERRRRYEEEEAAKRKAEADEELAKEKAKAAELKRQHDAAHASRVASDEEKKIARRAAVSLPPTATAEQVRKAELLKKRAEKIGLAWPTDKPLKEKAVARAEEDHQRGLKRQASAAPEPPPGVPDLPAIPSPKAAVEEPPKRRKVEAPLEPSIPSIPPPPPPGFGPAPPAPSGWSTGTVSKASAAPPPSQGTAKKNPADLSSLLGNLSKQWKSIGTTKPSTAPAPLAQPSEVVQKQPPPKKVVSALPAVHRSLAEMTGKGFTDRPPSNKELPVEIQQILQSADKKRR